MSRSWFVLRVQSGREDSIRDMLWKRIQSEGLNERVPTLMVATERITEIKGGKKTTKQQKLYPNYLVTEIECDEEGEIPDDLLVVIRETSGVGDFLGAREKPHPMADHEVEQMLARVNATEDEEPQIKINFNPGDQVRINEGHFENFEGVVEEISPKDGMIKVMITIFGRPTPVDLEYWKLEAV